MKYLAKQQPYGRNYWVVTELGSFLCECGDENTAELIATALNLAENLADDTELWEAVKILRKITSCVES